MDSEDSDECETPRMVKRKSDIAYLQDEGEGAEMGMVDEEDINSEVCNIKALRDALRRQRQVNEQLQYELDEERNASADAAQEVLAMISRLQREKHEAQMEASLSKRIQGCTQQEMTSLELLIDEKDDVIEALQSEIQSIQSFKQLGSVQHYNNSNVSDEIGSWRPALKQLGSVQHHTNSNASDEIRPCRPADDFSEVEAQRIAIGKGVARDKKKKREDQVAIFIADDENENDHMNMNRNKKRCILITEKESNTSGVSEKESNTSRVSDQSAHASQLMEEDDKNNDNCKVVSNLDFSVSDRLARDEEVQQIIGRMQSLIEERNSMLQPIQS